LHRLRRNQPLTPGNNDKLRHFLLSQGFGTEQAIQQSAEECNGFGLFNRSLVGVPRTRPQRLLALWLSSPPQQPEHQAQGC
jgi:type I restriction enzyme R subunit